jgi:excinuclease ABC subunit C
VGVALVSAGLPPVRALPSAPGVYRFRDANGRALYLGRAADLRRRVSSYWGGLRDRPRLRRMVARVEAVEAVACDSEYEAAWLERNLLEQAKPRWNRAIGGLEVIVYIGLHDRFEVRHEANGPGLLFGPYLGGERVRLAVSGLRRAIPLTYAGERLGGFDRDMARALGIAPGSRPALADLAAAVLRRETAAGTWVQRELDARRDAASTALAFELAARIHEEQAALAWILSEQKVTRTGEAPDADVHGWADGLLVTFLMRKGRVRSWTQRPCDEGAARRLVDATPAEWRTFADRNAALAARLAA